MTVFLMRPCSICGEPTIHRCCWICVRDCNHNYILYHEGPFADIFACERCGNKIHGPSKSLAKELETLYMLEASL